MQAIQFQPCITCCIPRADDQEEYSVGRTPATVLTSIEELQGGTMQWDFSFQIVSYTSENGGSNKTACLGPSKMILAHCPRKVQNLGLALPSS